MFGYDDLSESLVVRVRIVVLVAVKEHHCISELLHCLQFPQVREQRSFVMAAVGTGAQLARHQNWHLEITGHDLKISNDFRHMALAFFKAGS